MIVNQGALSLDIVRITAGGEAELRRDTNLRGTVFAAADHDDASSRTTRS